MLRGYFAGLPSELDDAGLMDGLTRLQIITRIAMPLSTPAIATVALYVFMIAWNEFLFAFMFLDDVKLFTLSRGIVSLDSSESPPTASYGRIGYCHAPSPDAVSLV